MAENQKYYLAMYDIRGKQEFIFRTNHIKEIVGGSSIIRDCFEDYLYRAARDYRNTLDGYDHNTKDAIYRYMEKDEKGESRMKQGAAGVFDVAEFKKRMNGTQFLGEVVYDGGGNFLVLYKSEKDFKAINRIFTEDLLREIGTLKVLCTCVEVPDFEDYERDRKRLYDKHRKLEATESVIRPTAMLPFTQIDPQTSMPLVEVYAESNKKISGKVSRESLKKLEKYKEECEARSIKYGETYLDYLVKEKGEDSTLAVIFIDGNNMGAQVQALLEPVDKDYASCINTLRTFSQDIQRNYVDDRVRDIEDMLNDRHPEDSYFKHRMVVFAGDEMSFIVRAEDAWAAVKAYFDGINAVNAAKIAESTVELCIDCADNIAKGKIILCNQCTEKVRNLGIDFCSSCAGIALFHSHAPYAEAYAIAEECCENAKKFMKSDDPAIKKKEWKNTCLVDFHYCQGGLGMDLDTIREREVGDLISKPWVWLDPGNKTKRCKDYIVKIEEVDRICDNLDQLDSRTNVKGLAVAAMESESALYEELARIKAHHPDKSDLEIFKLKDERGRKLLYDIVMVYDQWFKKPEKQTGREEDGQNA